jgi:hypothetical protein
MGGTNQLVEDTVAQPGISHGAETALWMVIGDWPSSAAICLMLQPA